MPTLFAFRLSTYLTLALACLCVSYAEWTVLRQASYFGGVVLALLGVAFWCEGRYELDLSAANRLGFIIGIVAAGWIAVQFVNKNSLIYTLPWPTSLLPYLGPLLMILMPAKLFRPKHTGDWWAMQGIGLAAAGLAAAIEDDAVFVVLLGLYAVAGVWSLSLFFYLRVGGLLPAVPRTDPGPTPTILASHVQVERVQFGGQFFGQTLVWVAVAVLLALPLFFLTPRSNAPPWQFGRTRLETGMTTDQAVDLNKAGDLQVNREIVYEVRARARDGSPYLDLPGEQRFRYYTFANYDAGRWQKLGSSRQNTVYARGASMPLLTVAPDLGPGQIELTFAQKIVLPAPVLADPVAWRVDQPAPVSNVEDGTLWFQPQDGFFAPRRLTPAKSMMPDYRQLVAFNPPPDRDLGPPFELSVPFVPAGQAASPENPLVRLRTVRLARLQAWSVDFFKRLALTDPVVAECLARAVEKPQFQFLPRDYEAVAVRLAAYFQASTDYQYTLKLRRLDLTVDPVEEFLVQTREGHCERFAAATALILRCVGIPTQYVLGYKGCEGDDGGVYTIRQEHAHAWVDVLVPRPAPPGFPFAGKPPEELDGQVVVWHWLSIDPTPGGDAEAVAATPDGFRGVWTGTVSFLTDFVVGYNAERRRRIVQSFVRWVIHGPGRFVLLTVALLAGLPAVVLIVRARRKRRPSVAPSGLAWFDRYQALVAKSGLRTDPGQTPRESAAALDQSLGTDAASRVVERYYLARFAGRPVQADEAARLDGLVATLQAKLAGRTS